MNNDRLKSLTINISYEYDISDIIENQLDEYVDNNNIPFVLPTICNHKIDTTYNIFLQKYAVTQNNNTEYLTKEEYLKFLEKHLY